VKEGDPRALHNYIFPNTDGPGIITRVRHCNYSRFGDTTNSYINQGQSMCTIIGICQSVKSVGHPAAGQDEGHPIRKNPGSG
jgi:hypothetical protein